jgi:hypothetical protein
MRIQETAFEDGHFYFIKATHEYFHHITEYIFYCKRAILFFSSSKIVTPPSPSPPGECVLFPRPRLCCEGRTDSPGGEGDGVSIFWKTREIGLPSYSKICTLCTTYNVKLMLQVFCLMVAIILLNPAGVNLINRKGFLPIIFSCSYSFTSLLYTVHATIIHSTIYLFGRDL